MATVKYEIEIDETVFSQICDAFAASYGYQETIKDEEGNDIANPDSKIDFMRKQTAKFWQEVLMNHLRQQAWQQSQAQLNQIEVALNAQSV
jgi:hypothetical protein